MRAPSAIALKLTQHPNGANSWKQVLNNLRLVIQPSVILNLLQPWLELFHSAIISWVRVFGCADESLPGNLPRHEPQADFHFLCLERHKEQEDISPRENNVYMLRSH